MTKNEIKNVSIVGAGTIGASWATLFITKGYQVKMYDAFPEACPKALVLIEKNLSFLQSKEVLSKTESKEAFDRLQVNDNLSDALLDADYVQESVAENYDIKKKLFSEMDNLTPVDTILASSSSGLLISEIQKATIHPERCLLAHPFNPPHLIPLVELVGGEKTSEVVVQRTKSWMEKLGKVPVVLNKEVPGHLANRLAAAVWREAIDLVVDGVASVEDVDKALSAGPGIRWALMGQHLIFHLGGGPGGLERFIDTLGHSVFHPLWQELKTWDTITPDMKEKLVAGVIQEQGERSWGDLASWRDDKLIQLLKILY